MNVLLELDEDDPDKFYLSGGLKRALEALKSTFRSLILIVVLFFIWVGVMFWEHLIQYFTNWIRKSSIPITISNI
jgi:hypothetical protein